MTIRSLEGGKLTPFTLYPVINNIQNWTVPVGVSFTPEASTDDGHWISIKGVGALSYSYTSAYGVLGKYNTTYSANAWFIFKNLIIPPGSRIKNAYLYLMPYSIKDTTTVNLRIYLNDTVIPTYPTTWSIADDLVLSELYVDWNNVPAWNPAEGYSVSPDISTLIQYMIDKSGWVFSYNMMVVIRDNGSSDSSYREFKTWNNTGKYLPILKIDIEYPTTNWRCCYPLVSGDDGYWVSGGAFDSASDELKVGLDTTVKNSFIRFPNVDANKGDVIDYAYLANTTLYNGDTTNPVFASNIYFNKSDNAIAPTNATEADALDLITGCKMDYSQSWETPIQAINSYNIGAAMSVLINRIAWVKNNALLLAIKDNSSSSYLSFYSVENGEYYPFLLFYIGRTAECTAGYVWGGYDTSNHNDIDKITFSTETQSLLTTKLPTTLQHAVGANSYLDGFNLGSGSSNIVYGLKFLTEVMRTAREAMDYTRAVPALVNSNYDGFELGGGGNTTIQGFNFSSEISRTLSATLDQAKSYNYGMGNETKGWSLGGLPGSGSRKLIKDLIYSTETSTLLANTLDEDMCGGTDANSLTRGFYFGGSIGASYGKIIEGFDFASEVAAKISTVLEDVNTYSACTHTREKAYVCGGFSGTTYFDVIQAFTFSLETISTLSIVLSVGRCRFSGMQNGGVL